MIKDAEYLFKLLDEIIDEVCADIVVQVIRDNASNYITAGKMLMHKIKYLFWAPCAAHCIDLILEKIGKKKMVEDLITTTKLVTKYIYNHGRVLSWMRKNAGDREILRPLTTHFATNLILTESMIGQVCNLNVQHYSLHFIPCFYFYMIFQPFPFSERRAANS